MSGKGGWRQGAIYLWLEGCLGRKAGFDLGTLNLWGQWTELDFLLDFRRLVQQLRGA